jgi:hypothetical protein
MAQEKSPPLALIAGGGLVLLAAVVFLGASLARGVPTPVATATAPVAPTGAPPATIMPHAHAHSHRGHFADAVAHIGGHAA